VPFLIDSRVEPRSYISTFCLQQEQQQKLDRTPSCTTKTQALYVMTSACHIEQEMDKQQPRCSECQFHSWSWLQTPSDVQFVRILCDLFPYFSNIAEIKWQMNNEIMWVKGVYHSQSKFGEFSY